MLLFFSDLLLFCKLFLLVLPPRNVFFELFDCALGNEELSDSNVQVLAIGVLPAVDIHVFIVVALAVLLFGGLGHGELLFPHLPFFLLDPLLGRLVTGLDDGQEQIEQEECTDEHHGDEEEERPWRIRLLIHDHDLRPALHGDALEDIEQSPENVVEVGDVIVRIEGLPSTKVANWAAKRATNYLFALFVDQSCTSIYTDTSLLQLAHEEVQATDGEDKEEEEQDNNSVL